MTVAALHDFCAPWRTHATHWHDRRLWLALEAVGYRIEQRRDESLAGLVRSTGGWYWRISYGDLAAEHSALYQAAEKFFDHHALVATIVMRELIKRHEESAESVARWLAQNPDFLRRACV